MLAFDKSSVESLPSVSCPSISLPAISLRKRTSVPLIGPETVSEVSLYFSAAVMCLESSPALVNVTVF